MYEEGSVVLVRDLFCFVLFNLDFYISLYVSHDSILLLVFGGWYEICCVCFWCLRPIWKIIQLYTGVSFIGGLKRNSHRKRQTAVFNLHCLFPTEWPSWSCSHGSRMYTTNAISAYHHWSCEFESRAGKVYSIQHYVIKFISDLQPVCGFLQGLGFHLTIKLTSTI
jgi:hypothetical protein